MAITTYTELKASVLDWVNRPDLTTVVADFIRLAELEIAPLLRQKVVRDAITLGAEVVSLPDDLAELRSVRLATASYTHVIKMVTPETLADYRTPSTGVPQWGSVVDGELLLAPAPSADFEAEIIYFEALDPLGDANPTNSTLAEAPNIYLFAALAQAETYLEHDSRVELWAGKASAAIQNLNNQREQAELAAAPRAMRLPLVIG